MTYWYIPPKYCLKRLDKLLEWWYLPKSAMNESLWQTTTSDTLLYDFCQFLLVNSPDGLYKLNFNIKYVTITELHK